MVINVNWSLIRMGGGGAFWVSCQSISEYSCHSDIIGLGSLYSEAVKPSGVENTLYVGTKREVKEESMPDCWSEFLDDISTSIEGPVLFDTCPSWIQYLSVITYYELVTRLPFVCLDYWHK